MQIRKAEGFALIDLIFVCGIIGLLCEHRAAAAAAGEAVGRRRVGDRVDARGQQRAVDLRSDVRLRLLRAEPDDARHGASRKQRAVHRRGSRRRRLVSSRAATSIQVAATAVPRRAGYAATASRPARGGRGFAAAADPVEPTNPRFFATNANNVIYEHTATLLGIMPEAGDPPVGAIRSRLIQL